MPHVVGNYEILEPFFESGPSTFFRARNRILGNDVIARRLTVDPARADDAKATFFREMRHAAGLQHSHIARPLDVFEAEGAVWSVQDPRIGEASSERVEKRGTLTLVEAAQWGGEVADAAAYVHGRGFLLGRVAPRWILVDPEGAMLVALTKSADLAAGIWPLRAAVAALSPFTAPEEVAGARPTAEGDVYSIAATVTWWLTREWPYGGATPEEAMALATSGGRRIDVRSRRPDVPAHVASVLDAALERDPAARRGSAASLATVLVETQRRLSAEVPRGFEPGVRLRPQGNGEAIELRGRHGSGAFGIVFRAQPVGGGPALAVKALKPEHRDDPDVRERFVREARVLQAIDHENVVRIRAVGEEAGTPYVVMEFVEGPDLATLLLREGALPPSRAARLSAGIARAVAAIHGEGVVHRDLKPHNVLLAPGDRPVLADFGLAKTLHATRMTMSGMMLGTPAYMAPEQMEGREAAFPADLYSLGAILYELLTCRPPFQERDAISTMRAIREDPPDPLPADVPAPLALVVLALLEKDPSARPPSAAAVAETLEAIACELGPAPADGIGCAADPEAVS